MNELNCGSSFPHRRCDSLNGSASDIAGRENARHAGLELEWRAIERPTGRARREIGPRQNEALAVALHHTLQIVRVRRPSNEDEERLRPDGLFDVSGIVDNCDRLESILPMHFHHSGVESDLDIGCRLELVDEIP